jgi:GntR family transcriptional repressor for pyruvate dehydrogenase complex
MATRREGPAIGGKRAVFNSVRGQSLSSRIVRQVIEALFARKLEPGQFLGTEAQLAETFQTSRVPIREALGRLEALGAVRIKTGAGGGVTVAEGDPDLFAIALTVQLMLVKVTPGEMFDARIAVECRGVELAAEHITTEELDGLQALFDQIATGQTGRPAVERILHFHSRIVDASRSRMLITLMHGLEHALLNLYLEASPDHAGAAPRGYNNLRKLIACLRARDVEGASATMRAHLLRQRAQVMDQLGRLDSDD